MDENEKVVLPQEDEQVEETTEEVEETTEEQTEEAEQQPKETPEAKRARLKRQLQQLDKKYGFKDEEEQAEEKPKPKAKPQKASEEKADTSFDIDAKILKVSKGLSDDEIERAKKIAAVEEIDLVSAIDTDLFKDWKEKRDREIDADLRASRGGASKRKEKTFTTPNLSESDHKALWQKAMRQ